MPPPAPDEGDMSTRARQASLLGQVDAVYRLLANPPTAGLKHLRLAEARSRAQVSSAITRKLGVARGLWRQRWCNLMPAEREGIVVAILRAYCKSRTDPAGFDWAQLDYLSLLAAVGANDSTYEADLDWLGPVEAHKDDAPWLEIRKHVDDIADACARGRSDALYGMRIWKVAFLSQDGITRLKLRRLKVAERKAVAREVALVLKHVHEYLSSSSSSPLDTVLLSADDVFTRARNAIESPSSRFNALCGFLDDLVILYTATLSHDDAVAQLSAARGMLERRTHVKRDHGFVKMRTAEASFTELSVAQQVAAVEQGRTIVFEACVQHRETGQPPAVEPLLHKLLEPLHDPRALAPLKRWRLCIDNLSAVVRLYEEVYQAHEDVAKSLSHQLAILDMYPAAELFVELPEERQVAAVRRCRSMFSVLSSMTHGLLPSVHDVVANILNVLPHPASDPVYRNAASTRSLHSLEHRVPPSSPRRSPRSPSTHAQRGPYFPSARAGLTRRSWWR